jgi:hypothetical protein
VFVVQGGDAPAVLSQIAGPTWLSQQLRPSNFVVGLDVTDWSPVGGVHACVVGCWVAVAIVTLSAHLRAVDAVCYLPSKATLSPTHTVWLETHHPRHTESS